MTAEELYNPIQSNADPVVKINNLRKSFGDLHVLKNISFELNKGENLVVLGQSGCGKSVLIKCMVGLIEPDGGAIVILGENPHNLTIKDLNALRKKIGFLFQSGALYDSMTVRENLAFRFREEKEMKEAEINQLIEEALEQVGLPDTGNKMPSELSGGMRKRIGLARTIILKPEIILYDEPTTGLDPITSKEMSELILSIQKKYQCTSIIITHDIECAKLTSNKVMLLKEGLVKESGTFSALQKSSDEWVHSFLN
ncbi:MAG: ABC transporter ATP-binding protein [Bacteroidia bacterium]|jgi:phospholipid/cholesterol/gamma-HCH transport system ATP-binding protein